jgi:hypothetical protein
VRRDLPLGTAAAMLVHAAGETGPVSPGTYAIVLQVENETALKKLYERLHANEVQVHPIFEPDHPWNGQLMAIGCWPCSRHLLRKYLKHLKLYQGDSQC